MDSVVHFAFLFLVFAVAASIINVGLLGNLTVQSNRMQLVINALDVTNCTGSDSSWTESELCDDANECTLDLLYATNASAEYCQSLNRPSSTSCSTECYNEGTTMNCNGQGVCVTDNATACKGWCAMNSGGPNDYDACDTATLFPMWPYFEHGYDAYDLLYPWSHTNLSAPTGTKSYCFANQCVLPVMQLMMEYTPDPLSQYYQAGASGVECLDMIDNTRVDPSCIEAHEYYSDTPGMSQLFQAIVSDPWENITGRFCIFTYACSRINGTLLMDEDFLASVQSATPSDEAGPFKRGLSAQEEAEQLVDRISKRVIVESALSRVRSSNRKQRKHPSQRSG